MSHDFVVTQEPDVVRARRLSGIGAGGVVITVVSLVIAGIALGWGGRGRDHGAAEPKVATPQIGTIEQTLATSTRRGLDMQALQRHALSQYGWADRDAGLAKIPIERAIDIVAGEGP